MAFHVLLAAKWLLIALVMVGTVPLIVANYQFLLVADHFRRLHYERCAPVFPRTAILIPAWSEAAVIGASDAVLLSYCPGIRADIVKKSRDHHDAK
jgi:hypothetical protein